MSHFEVQNTVAGSAPRTVLVEARHWTEALIGALDALGEPLSLVDRMTIEAVGGVVRVAAAPSPHVFTVREVAGVEATLEREPIAVPPPPPSVAPAKIAGVAGAEPRAAALGEPGTEVAGRRTKAKGTIAEGARVRALRAEVDARVVSTVGSVQAGAPRAAPGKVRSAMTISDSAVEAVFLRFGASLVSASDGLVAAERVVEFMEGLFPAQGHAVLFFDDLDHVFRFAAVRGSNAKGVLKSTVPSGAGIVGFALRSDTTVRVDDVAGDDRFFAGVDAASGTRTTSVLCAPISHGGRTWGCLEVINPDSRFSDDDVNGLAYMGRSFGAWIDALPDDA